MTFVLTAALILTILAFLWQTDRQYTRQTAERASHRAEVASLLQRIQAPERAVTQHEIADVEVDLPQESSRGKSAASSGITTAT